jgi:hypothetical protein
LQLTSLHRVLQHRARAVVALVALALAAAVLAACGGGGGGGSSEDAQTLLKQTFTGKHKLDSGKADLQLAIDAQGGSSASLKGPIKLGVTGPFQSAGSGEVPKFDLALDISAQGQTLQAGLTSTSDQLYVNFAGTAYQAPASLVSQLKQSMAKAQQKSSSSGKLDIAGLGLDPMSWLSDPKVTGTEDAGGVEADHITAKLNVGALLDDLDKILAQIKKQGLGSVAGGSVPDRIPAGTRKQIEDAVKQATVDVWTGTDDKTLRKLALALTIEPKNPGSGPKSVAVDFSLELSNLNEPQSIKAPSSPRPLSELLTQLQGLLGGALPGLSGGSGGASGTGSAPIDRYTQCLKDAGSDVAKAQACAALLTK